MDYITRFHGIYRLVNVDERLWKDPPSLNGKNSLFLWPCSIAMFNYQRLHSLEFMVIIHVYSFAS